MMTIDIVPDNDTHTLRYRSSRAEIWRTYWRAWRKKFWVIHVIVAADLAWLCSTNTLASVALWFAAWLPVVVVCLAAFPQIMFKPQERMLQLTPEGWSTTIGRKSGSKRWNEIRGLADTPDGLVIVGVNGNAMVVPLRAFEGGAHRAAVVADVRSWFIASQASG